MTSVVLALIPWAAQKQNSFFYKTSYFNNFNEEANCTEPSLSDSIPCQHPSELSRRANYSKKSFIVERESKRERTLELFGPSFQL